MLTADFLVIQFAVTQLLFPFITPLRIPLRKKPIMPKHLFRLVGLRYCLDDPEFESLPRQGIFLVSEKSRLAPRPAQSSIQWVPGFFPEGLGVMLITYAGLAPRLRISGAIPNLPSTPCGVDRNMFTSGQVFQI